MNLMFMDAEAILQKALAGERLFPDEAIHLCAEGDLLRLALTARAIDRRRNPDGNTGFAVSKTVIYSNVCQPRCPFCVGTVVRDDPAAFTKSADDVVAEVAEAVGQGATQIVLQGGHRIDLPWSYYPGLVRAIKDRFPQVQVLAYSPTEIMVFNVAYQKRTSEVIGELKEAGMGAMIAGGDESMPTRVPEYQALLRGPWNEWFDVVHRCADAGVPVIAPFVFGLGESPKERVGHLYRIRAVQERTAAHQKPAFAAVAVFNLTAPAPGSATPVAEEQAKAPSPVTGHEYLRMVALARILVPQVPHVQASFVSQGAKVAQVALDGGADDLGGTHLEYDQVDLAAGRVGAMSPEEMERLITDAGRTTVRRAGW